MSDYAAFLERKIKAAPAIGVEASPDEIHPLLYGWQRESTLWALRTGRCALFWDCGLGKTFAQVEWARLSAERSLIVAPLSVARQTVREARKIDVDIRYVRNGDQVDGPGIWITNYEMAERFDPAAFGAVVLDESSILKNVDGKTRARLTHAFSTVPRRLCASATPAPNDVAELTNHAEFLGVMSRAEMLAAYFINDQKDWRLKGHAAGPMFRWMSTWAQAVRRPSDLGYPDDDWELPPLRIVAQIVDVEIDSPGQLFPTTIGGVGGRAAVRRQTLDARVRRVLELVSCPNTTYNGGYESRGSQGLHTEVDRGQSGAHQALSRDDEGTAERAAPGAVCAGRGASSAGTGRREALADGEPGQAQGAAPTQARSDADAVPGDADGAEREMRDLRIRGSVGAELLPGGGPLPRVEESAGPALHELQPGARKVQGRSGAFTRGDRVSGEPWIIWCGLNEEQTALAKALGDRCISIYGTLSPDEKERRLVAWLEGERPILLSKPSVCGFGLNLQRASRMAFVGLGDSYEAYYQAIRRCWRFGQTRPVEAHIVVSQLEDQIVQNVQRKEREARYMTDQLIRHMSAPREVAA